jgi:hypothetical protein
MSDPVRRDLLRELERLSELAPELRLGQLIANLAFLAKGPWDQVLWDLEDGELLEAARKNASDLQQSRQSVA